MIPNAFERIFFVDNALRAAGQRRYEAPLLERLGGTVEGGRALEVGCGRGVGVTCIIDQFRAGTVVAIDMDERKVALARQRLAEYGDRVTVREGDMSAIDEPDESFDAVFAFQVVHHTPWRRTVQDIARVLRPGGRFYFFEPTKKTLARFPAKVLFDHPDHGMFASDEFVEGVEKAGMLVGDRWRNVLRGVWLGGVGVKS